MEFKRSSGILLHPTSLPGEYGIGCLGKEALSFIDFLEESGQKIWQVCPLGPTGYGDSPYQCFSAYAGNPLLIDIKKLENDGLVKSGDFQLPEFNESYVDFGPLIEWKYPILRKAFDRLETEASEEKKEKFNSFCDKHSEWLDDYALFISLKSEFGGKPWFEWDEPLKLMEESAVEEYRTKLSTEIEYHKFLQFEFFTQWEMVKAYANSKGISIVGDIPLYVAYDSADAWGNPEIFQFDERRNPTGVAGVPPDYFSATGQLWGNPLYNWDYLKDTGFSWWIKRVKANLALADIIRIDHFRGLSAYWSVPYGEETAINGEWIPAPGKELFEAIEKNLGKLPIWAEDLGVITPDVEELRDGFQLPGMKILQFAFDTEEDSSSFLPHLYTEKFVVYTGTHDNDTTKGWYDKAADKDKAYATDYLCLEEGDEVWGFVKGCWRSVAMFALAPMQDILGLGDEARMNTPGRLGGNWQWRVKDSDLNADLSAKLKRITKIYGR